VAPGSRVPPPSAHTRALAVSESALEGVAEVTATEAAEAAAAEAAAAEAAEAAAAAVVVDASAPPEGEDDGEVDAPDTDEGESYVAGEGPVPEGPLYTAELSDEELSKRWKEEPALLGSVSVGFVQSGRMVNSVQFPAGEGWVVISPEAAWATQETVDYLSTAARAVHTQYPRAPPLRVNQISAKEGGYLRPHKSHQNGRDVDLGFYYPTADPVRARERERYMDPALNWALVRALVVHTDVEMILVDRRVQKVLYDYALSVGEDKAWLDSLFNAGFNSLVKHARRHRDHFHVRFFNPRAQELGRRIAPLLALQPDQNRLMHRVRSGDTLGAIAMRYGSSVSAIQRASGMRSTLLRIGQVLTVPLRGPCTQCPIPPPVVVPPRRLPPEKKPTPVAGQQGSGSAEAS
jgi:LysM repeat protein